MSYFRIAIRPFMRVAEWIGGHELIVLIAMTLLVTTVWGFVELAEMVKGGGTHEFDERVVASMRRADDPAKPIGPPWLAEMGRDITALGGVVVLGLMTVGVGGYLMLDGKYSASAFVVGATASGLLITGLLKAQFDRPRPDIVPHLSIVHTTSFPSGHSMMSAIVYLTLGSLLTRLVSNRRLRFYVLSVAVTLTMLVGVSRVYMGVHYPTDVLAGWLAGLSWATICWLVARRWQQRGRIEPRS